MPLRVLKIQSQGGGSSRESRGFFFGRPPASALSAFPFKGVRVGMTVLKHRQPRCLQTLTPVAIDTGTTLDGRGNLPCPRSGNLAADPVFFRDPTNALGGQAVSAVRSRGSSLILATAPLPLLPPSEEKNLRSGGFGVEQVLAVEPRRGSPSSPASWLQPLRLSVCAKETLTGGLKAKGWVLEGPVRPDEELGKRGHRAGGGLLGPGGHTQRADCAHTRPAHTHRSHAHPRARAPTSTPSLAIAAPGHRREPEESLHQGFPEWEGWRHRPSFPVNGAL